jgi:hypothetical protein
MSMRRVIATWWPLAFSWMLMSMEGPAMSAVVARLAEPKINLAAYGGVVFPLALIIESPIIMLLAASTALSKDWASYQLIRRFMMTTSAVLTGLHMLVVFTPLYYVFVQGIIGAPQEIVEPARIGLMIMIPWTWSIAYRRFNQGVLIRFGHSKAVGMGTIVRLSANLLVLAAGYLIGTLPGIVVGSSAVACGVISEAVYIGFVVRPVLTNELKPAPPVHPALTLRAFLDFYIPLAMTSLIILIANPIGSAALSRMPQALESLAVWSVVTGLVFLLRSLGIAYNEVVVALLDEPGSSPSLRRFANYLSLATTASLLLVVATPLVVLWFGTILGLSPDLVTLAQRSLWLALPLPALSVMQSYYQGAILHGRRTQGITESVVIFLMTSILTLAAGVAWGKTTGLYVGMLALTCSVLTQTIWLWHRSVTVLQEVRQRDTPIMPLAT